MPILKEYQCDKCKGTFDSFHDMEGTICFNNLEETEKLNSLLSTSCNGTLHKIISAPALYNLKGSGWTPKFKRN